MKVKKGTDDYNKTLNNCLYTVREDYIKKTKTSKVSDQMKTILSLVGSTMNQNERRSLSTAIPVTGVELKTKKNLQVDRNRELLKLPLFRKYNSPPPYGIQFEKMELEELPVESYPIFLKYLSKGVTIPTVLEDHFDNPKDPKFYTKLLRIAIKQKIKLSEHFLSFIIQQIENDKIDIDQVVPYYKNILNRNFSENLLKNYNIKNPTAILEYQVIKDTDLFFKLLRNLRKIRPSLFKTLLENYSNDSMKLLMIYYILLETGNKSSTKIEKILEDKLTLEDFEKFLDDTTELEISKGLLGPLYVKLLLKPTGDINKDHLRDMFMEINDIEVKLMLMKLYDVYEDFIDLNGFAEIYANLPNNTKMDHRFEILNYFFKKMQDEGDVNDFVSLLQEEHQIEIEDLKNVLKNRFDELPNIVKNYLNNLI
jgi:hypothetical protein